MEQEEWNNMPNSTLKNWDEYEKQSDLNKKYMIISMNEINRKEYMRAIKIILLIFSGILVLSICISIAYSCI